MAPGTSGTKLQLLGVGTGRDGAVSLTEVINRIYRLNGIGGKAAHEYAAWDCYGNFCEFRETGKHRHLGAIDTLIRQCPNSAIIGNGYAFVLDRFAAISAGGIRLLHVRRADRAAWDALPLESRVAWFYDATHRSIAAQKHLFAAYMVIETGGGFFFEPDSRTRQTTLQIGLACRFF